MVTIAIDIEPPQGETPPRIKGVMADRIAFTNGDYVRGEATIVVKSGIEVSSLKARCQCRTFAKTIQNSAATTEESKFMWCNENYILPSPVPCGYDLPQVGPNTYAMGPGTYKFPFQFRLPRAYRNLPESLEEAGCISGIFWEVQFLIKRAERLSKNSVKIEPIRFIPMAQLPKAGELSRYRHGIVFNSHNKEFKPTLLGRFSNKNRLPVKVEATVSLPKGGLAQAPLYLDLGLQVTSDTQNVVVVEDIHVVLLETTRIYVPSSDSAYERGTIRHTLAKMSPRRLLNEKVVDFSELLRDLQIHMGLIGSIEEANFDHLYQLKVQLILQSMYYASNRQKLTVQFPVTVIPQQLEHLPEYLPAAVL